MSATQTHRLDGLPYDNLLAWLALLGALRAIGHVRPELQVRASWTLDVPPLRPQLHLRQALDRAAMLDAVAEGAAALAGDHDFGGQVDLNHSPEQARHALSAAACGAQAGARGRADLLAALMSDAAIKDGKAGVIDPTPLCLLFGQGHQHFLKRLSEVPRMASAPARGRGKHKIVPTPAQTLEEALFEPWQRQDPSDSFRWDPAEDVRYATMGGDPTDPEFKPVTQHGANRLAALGLPVFTVLARHTAGRIRPVIPAGSRDAKGAFGVMWPIWRLPMSLLAIQALLTHPQLAVPGALAHLGVVNVLLARRISVGKFMNFTPARPVQDPTPAPTPAPS